MSTNLEYKERERQRWRESRRQASETQREEKRLIARARDKKKKGNMFCWRYNKKFCGAVEKMRNAKCHQGENERQWKKKVNKNTCYISSIKRVTRMFLEVSRCSRAKQWQRNVLSVLTRKVAFLLIIVFFSPFSLPSPLSVTPLYIL